MRICLLVCDHVAPELSALHGTYPEMYQTFLPNLKLKPFFVCDGDFPNVEQFDAFICTGSSFSVYEEVDWIVKLTELIREIRSFGKKLIGICFGHQMIAHALGGEVKAAGCGWNIGMHSFKVLQHEEWMVPEVENYDALMLCQDQVVRMPSDAELLSSSNDCPVGMFTLGRSVLAMQCHPEFSKAYNQAVYRSRSEIIDAGKIKAAELSLRIPFRPGLLRGWVNGFLTA